MSYFEYLPHEYSYACYLAYIYDFSPYDSMILNNFYQVGIFLAISYFCKVTLAKESHLTICYYNRIMSVIANEAT
ncbi:transmembrane protein, putative [Medicago truncatula]|uniref:Transmembrane protein, putative n=1 Tax=Medicago truncatula TaxID=3880 RepID=A0A072UV96_MEDTR|nr:transmembrane protein, putative [Medicago truncatula]